MKMKLKEFRKIVEKNPIKTPQGHILALQREYLVKTTYPVSLIYDFFKQKHKEQVVSVHLDGDWVNIRNIRIATFLEKGVKCAVCGIEGKFFSKEKCWVEPGLERYHLNLYAVGKNGGLTMITMDHIHPKCKGGKDILNNAQVLCEKCNIKKDKMSMEQFQAFIAENRGHLWFGN